MSDNSDLGKFFAWMQAFPGKLASEQRETLFNYFKTCAEKIPRCNACGDYYESSFSEIQANVCWGYHSTGKDGDLDNWKLCSDCSNKFKLQFEPICSGCRRSVVEVMAELYARNPHTVYYGAYDEALNYFRTSKHCGLQYAEVAGCVLCELCYEDYISNFKVPILAGSYDFFTGDPIKEEGVQRIDRITEALTYQLQGDAASSIYETWLPYNEAVHVRKAPDKKERIIKLSFRKSDSKMLTRHLAHNSEYEDTATLTLGDGSYVSVPVSYLAETAESRKCSLDLTSLSIDEDGTIACFGDLRLPVAELSSKFKEKDN